MGHYSSIVRGDVLFGYRSSGDFKKTYDFLNRLQGGKYFDGLDGLARKGAQALASATPIESGETSRSWSYEIERSASKTTIYWTNTHVDDGVNVAVILQYGHGTGTGGYVAGRDYINPAIKPVMDQIAKEVWKKVNNG